MRATLKDVAEIAKVSTATVSKIINNKKGGYSKETKEKVLGIIKENGYEANAIARGLATKSSRIIGVLVPDVATTFFIEVLNGIEEVAHKNDYCVVICNTGNNGERALQYIKSLSANQVAGIIYTSSPISEECFEIIRKRKIPCVLALTISQKFQVPYVKVDDHQAAYCATQYLIDKGHQKIAMIGGEVGEPTATIPRLEGYLQALTDYRVEVKENLITFGDFSYESGEQCMEQLLDQEEQFTAIFAVSDEMAIGALNVAHRRGRRVPEELSIIGYDNSKVSKMSFPPLTTVSQPLYEMGKKVAEKLLKVILDGEVAESSIMMHEIIERDTVRCLYEK